MPTNYCYSPNYVVLRRYQEYDGLLYSHFESRYYFASKKMTVVLISKDAIDDSVNSFSVDNNTIIDFDNSGNNNTRIYYAFSGVSISVENTFYANRIVLYKKLIASSPFNLVEIKMFNKITKSEEILSSPTNAFCGLFTRAPLILATQCIGRNKNTWLWNGSTVNLNVEVNSESCGGAPPAENTLVTEIKTIRVVTECVSNPVMLVWKNSYNGVDRWLFGVNQTVKRKTESYGRTERPYFDLNVLESNTRDIGKSQTNYMTVGAIGLTKEDKDGIEHVMSSHLVYKLTKEGIGFKKEYVKVLPGSWISEETNDGSFSIELDIELPENYSII